MHKRASRSTGKASTTFGANTSSPLTTLTSPPATQSLSGTPFGTIEGPAVVQPRVVQPHLQKATLGALEASLTTGVFIDCQFNLYSRRVLDGTIDTPLPLYANSEVLKKTGDYFQSLIGGGFSESICGASSASEKLQRITVQDYEYDSDSDLDDDIDTSPSTPPTPSMPDHADDGPSKDAGEEAKTARISSSAGEESSLLEEPVNGQSEPGHALNMKGKGRDAFSEDKLPVSSNRIPIRHTINITDVAFRTFRAFVYYAYTGHIRFATLRSIKALSTYDKENLLQPFALECSPKSMYRFADKYGLLELKKLAVENIRSQLSSQVVLQELFSRFTSRHSEILTVEINHIRTRRTKPDCLLGLQDWMDRVVRGELPHAAPALSGLIQNLARDT
ncbi:hypothetical protein BD414DRAFT_496996 [Trametes punicea]|nr:hypothetical protein BD414DRAFT_496996 [Trametes punicea]